MKTPDILFEDRLIRILNKPSGLHSVNNKSSADRNSVATWLAGLDSRSSGYADKEGDSGLINRLDFETSGILLAAKSREAWEIFSALLKKGELKKEYLILVSGRLSQNSRIENYIGSPYRNAKKVRACESLPQGGRFLKAVSVFEPLHYFDSAGVSFVRVIAETARRHQVRVHAAGLGSPLAGDLLYGSRETFSEVTGRMTSDACREDLPLFFLHARSVSFIHPDTGKETVIRAPLPFPCDLLFSEYLPG